MTAGTPYRSDELRIDSNTSADDIRAFVRRRTKDPIIYESEGVVVWNYGNHEIDFSALEEKLPEIPEGYYAVPYQISGVWGYVQDLLPEPIRNADPLVYSKKYGTYKAFPNIRRASDAGANDALREELADWVAEEV